VGDWVISGAAAGTFVATGVVIGEPISRASLAAAHKKKARIRANMIAAATKTASAVGLLANMTIPLTNQKGGCDAALFSLVSIDGMGASFALQC
jgi:hypothetical protein